MTSLIRNQSHNNKIITLYLPNLKVIRKFSYHSSGIVKLKKELKGWTWYQNKIKQKIISNVKISRSSMILDIKRIEGKVVNYNQSIIKTKKYLFNIIDHY